MYDRNIITFPVPVPYSCTTIRPIFPATSDQIEAISHWGIFLMSSTLVPVRFAKIRFATLPAFSVTPGVGGPLATPGDAPALPTGGIALFPRAATRVAVCWAGAGASRPERASE